MKLLVKRAFTWLLKLLLVFIVFIFFYSAVSGLFMLFPINNTQPSLKTDNVNHVNTDKVTTIYIQYGLAHTNIVIDLSSSSIAWGNLLPNLVPNQETKQETKQERGKEGFLLVGWGDKETYQSTPNWADLKVSVAIKALLINTPSALHIRYLEDLTWLGDSVIPLELSKTTSDAIENRILDTFRDNIPEIVSLGYSAGDRFYYSKGKYNIFNTCNTWTGDVLRQSGVSMSLWTPFSYNVVQSLSRARLDAKALEPREEGRGSNQ